MRIRNPFLIKFCIFFNYVIGFVDVQVQVQDKDAIYVICTYFVKIAEDTDRDFWMSPEEAAEYWLIDTVQMPRKPLAKAVGE